MPKAQIFIIHSEEDNYVLKRLVDEYHDQIFGDTTLQIRFVDSQSAEQLGKNFGDMIKQEIDHSRYVIVIVTPNSAHSVWVNQEIGYAIGKGKDILPMKKTQWLEKGSASYIPISMPNYFMTANVGSQNWISFLGKNLEKRPLKW